MNKIKIGYFADGPWSHQAFDRLANDPSVEISFVVPRKGSRDKALIQLAREHQIPCHENVLINSPEFLEQAAGYGCDLFVSMSFNQIFREPLLNIPKWGSINCHAGKLPFYRGRNILNWALINDEKEFGITVHHIDTGIDTGDIISQQTYPIRDSDTYRTLLERSYTYCADLLHESIKKIQDGTDTRIRQSEIHPVGFYCGMRGEGDEIIDWNQSSRHLFNFIRAVCDPAPKATTFFKGQTVRINKAKMIPDAPAYIGIPGQVVGTTSDGFVVKTQDTTLELLEIDSPVPLKTGDRLGS